MQKYQCHKIVEAMKIERMAHNQPYDVARSVTLIGFDGEAIAVTREFMDKHKPVPGGYFVHYEDGYESYSPAEAFEAGYSLVDEESVEDNVTSIAVNLPEGDGAPDEWDESMKYDPVELLDTRNFIEKVLKRDSSIRFGGSAGVGVDGADLDILIDGKRWNIGIKPRETASQEEASAS